ncbi:MAG TPA: sigma-54 dependent transcriptional regulator [Dongiaceae bacterium]|nr:sigma-54 dependent transcriptional regulator [Dongiaceae bacterium]
MARDILIVDDEADIRMLIAGILTDEKYTTREAGNSQEALAALKDRRPNLVILDIWLKQSEMDGLNVLDRIKQEWPDVPVIMISGHGNIETAVNAIKRGAYDFIEKPFTAARMLMVVERALDAARLKRENEELKQRSGGTAELVGVSAAIEQVRSAIEKAAPSASRVIFTGPPGSGKEVAARLLHRLSKRAHGPFVIVNCAIMHPDRLEMELFGVDASPGKTGYLEMAHGGTLLLDEIADMPLETQGKIVRVLHEQTFSRVGGQTRIQVDVRIVASSSKDLAQEMEKGHFRQDLFFRLNVVPIRLPSLRDRREDIPLLVTHLMARAAEQAGMAPRTLAEDAVAMLQTYEWPGNIRQLRNAIERILIMANGDGHERITAEMLPPDIGAVTAPANSGSGQVLTLPLREAREIFERQYLETQIGRFGGNISKTANFIGMERSALHRKLRALGITTGEEA